MIGKAVLIVAMGAFSLPAGAAPDPVPDVLKREGKWLASFNRDSCQLMAELGTGADVMIARFTQFEPGNGFQLSLFGNRLPRNDDREDMKIDFGIGKPVIKEAMLGTAGEYRAAFVGSLRIDGWEAKDWKQKGPDITAEQEAKTTGATVTIRGKSFRLEFGSLGKPMETMRNCLTDLVKSWGYDPQVQANLTREVMPANSPMRWLNSGDYPLSSLALGHNGAVQFRLDVDEAGKIAGCYVLDHTSPDDFADLTCKAVKGRAKLLPALDKDGKPVRSYFVQSVRWLAGPS